MHVRVVKPVEWLGDSLKKLKSWPKAVRHDVGGELQAVQYGRDPSDWKSMATIGLGVREIRVANDGDQYRVIYLAKFVEAVYVLHVITKKKVQKTAKRDLIIAESRYRELIRLRKSAKKQTA
jgi:phage-related protein